MHKGWYKEIEEDDENGFAQWGGYMNAKKAKLIKQVREQAGEQVQSRIFSGISIYVNGYTKPSAEELKCLMAQHSGIFHIYQMPSTTHIIATNLPNVKINKMGPLPIVKPSWIEDSVTLGRLLDYTKYLLYTNQSRTQPQLNFTKIDPQIVDISANGNVSKTKTASDPSFLSEFYGNSRLHLIATLGAEFKQFVNDLRAKAGSNRKFPGLEVIEQNLINIRQNSTAASSKQLTIECKEVIMHIDMDCFFVSVGIRNRPELKGKPVAVTHSKTGQGRPNVNRSVEIAMYKERLPDGCDFRLQDIDDSSSLSEIASCSYEARKMGVKNGMFMGQALKLCPGLKALPYDFDGYKEVSKTLYTTISEYTLNIEAVSCDEMYVNITNILEHTSLTIDEFAGHIRSVIRLRTGCPCSTGFGSNRLQARLATKRAKPDGAYHLKPEQVENYFYDMPLAELPGVGRVTLCKMKNLGLETCGDVQLFDLSSLQKEIGNKLGETIMEQAKGVDRKPLQYEHERKSVSAEVNYGIRFQSKKESLEFLERLAEEVTGRLVETRMRTKCVTLKLMVRAEDAPMETAKYLGHGLCDTISRSSSLTSATEDGKLIFREAQSIFEKLNVPFNELRGVGIQLSRLEKGLKMNAMLKSFLATAVLPKDDNIDETKNDNEKKSSHVQFTAIKKTGRGRPSGKTTKLEKVSSSKDLSHFFKSTQKDRSTKSAANSPSTTTNWISKPDIDLSVLQELPEDIREEIIKEYNLQLQHNDEYKSSQTAGTSTAAMVPTAIENSTGAIKRKHSDLINKNIICKSNQAKRKKEEEKCDSDENVKDWEDGEKVNDIKEVVRVKDYNKSKSGFESLTHEDFMAMLSNWLQSPCKPLQVDVAMLGQYFRDLTMQRHIEKMHVYIKYLHRNIGEKLDCEWHEAYFHICKALQSGMLLTYGKKLLIPRKFPCDKHNCI